MSNVIPVNLLKATYFGKGKFSVLIWYNNSISSIGKFDQLKLLVQRLLVETLVITESKLDKSFPRSQLFIDFSEMVTLERY